MAVNIRERPTSRDLTVDPKGCSASLEYWLQSDDPEIDAGDVNDYFANASPDVYKTMFKKRIRSTPQGGGFWYGVVEYGNNRTEGTDFPTPQAGTNFTMDDPLGFGIGFGSTGATQHITQSLETVFTVGDAPPDCKQAIGVSKNGVAGCDIVVPQFKLTVTREVKRLTMRYIHQLDECTGCTNSDLWNTFDPLRVLFLGHDTPVAQGGIGAILKWTITYNFLVSKVSGKITIPGITPIPAGKKGPHDYLWVGYRDAEEAAAGVILQVPKFAKIERVYESKNFADLLEF